MATTYCLPAQQIRRQRRRASAALCCGAGFAASGTTLLLAALAATLWVVAGQLVFTGGLTTAVVAMLALIHAGAPPWPILAGRVEPRLLLRRYPPQHVLAHGLYEVAVGVAGPGRGGRAREWHADLHECPAPLTYALSLVGAALRMRLADLVFAAWRVTCWMLASEVRTWGALIPVMVAALHQVLQSQGWGSAAWTLLTVPAVVDLVTRLRRRWNFTVKPLRVPLFHRPSGRHAHRLHPRRARSYRGGADPGRLVHRPAHRSSPRHRVGRDHRRGSVGPRGRSHRPNPGGRQGSAPFINRSNLGHS
ncbi:hypothetical protein [Nonomuraea wenchangensis]|uniref:hypothetical protein n=1 Tax=Nonomuraea wenchangensis TaxID=568860 RepID=UPI003321687F